MKKWCLILLVTLCYSCEDESNSSISRIDINAIADNPDNEFIYFEDGDTQYYYPMQFFLTDLSNKYMKESDRLTLNMTDSNDRYHCNVLVTGANIGGGSFPITLKANSNSMNGGLVLLELKDTSMPVDVVFGPDDNINFFGSNFNDEMTMVIISLDNNTIECSFEGKISTKTGSEINMKNGLLRVKLKP